MKREEKRKAEQVRDIENMKRERRERQNKLEALKI